jgi:uncharacterized coiled-coil DUF342 family protein
MTDIVEKLRDCGIADNETYRVCLAAAVEIETLRSQRAAYSNEITGSLLPANERLRNEIERLKSEINMALVARNLAEDKADEMFAGCQKRDAEIKRLRAALEAIVRKPGAVNGLGYDMKQIAREALGLEDPT